MIVRWGDGTASEPITHWRAHAYAEPGRYLIRVVATDRAGNETVERLAVTVQASPKPKHKTGGRKRPSGGVGK